MGREREGGYIRLFAGGSRTDAFVEESASFPVQRLRGGLPAVRARHHNVCRQQIIGLKFLATLRGSRGTCPLHPNGPVQAAVLQRFEQVVLSDILCFRQIRDGPRHLEDPVVSAGAEMQVLHGMLEQCMA
jgi:hypothetical protein